MNSLLKLTENDRKKQLGTAGGSQHEKRPFSAISRLRKDVNISKQTQLVESIRND